MYQTRRAGFLRTSCMAAQLRLATSLYLWGNCLDFPPLKLLHYTRRSIHRSYHRLHGRYSKRSGPNFCDHRFSSTAITQLAMDPITAFSLAVNVITTVDVAVKTGKTLRELYESTSGFTRETEELIQATGQLEKALAGLDSAQSQLTAAQSPGVDDTTATAARQCSEAMRAIKAILEQCRS